MPALTALSTPRPVTRRQSSCQARRSTDQRLTITRRSDPALGVAMLMFILRCLAPFTRCPVVSRPAPYDWPPRGEPTEARCSGGGARRHTSTHVEAGTVPGGPLVLGLLWIPC